MHKSNAERRWRCSGMGRRQALRVSLGFRYLAGFDGGQLAIQRSIACVEAWQPGFRITILKDCDFQSIPGIPIGLVVMVCP